jgi:hypothetical protein
VHRFQAARPDRVLLSLDRNTLERARVDGVFYECIGRVPDQDLARVCRLLQSLRDDYRLTRDECVSLLGIPCEDLAGVDSDAPLEAKVE